MLHEAKRFTELTFRTPIGDVSHERELGDGVPVTILAISGFVTAGKHLEYIRREALERLPRGSKVVLYEFGTKINLGLLNIPTFGLPLEDYCALRSNEVKKVGSKTRQLADTYQRRVRYIGWSAGGLVGLGAWAENPDDVEQLVAAGTPFGMPIVRRDIPQKPDTGRLDIVYAKRDLLVPPRYASHQDQNTIEAVEGGHFSLVTRPGAVSRIVDKVIYPSSNTAK